MESLKEFLQPKSFHPFSYFLVVGSLVTGIILFGVVADIETNQQRYSFSCRIEGQDKEFFQSTCYADYQAKTTRGFPLYGFVLLYFLCVTLVAILYSLSVRTRIEEIESQNQQAIPSNQSCRLYRSYCIQLVIRLTIGMIFLLILQWGVLYPRHFPSKHACDLTHIQQATPQVNATSGNTSGYWYDCYNPQADRKTSLTISVFTVIALLTFFILLELIYVVIKAKVNDHFKKDFEFFQGHLLNKTRVDRDQEESVPMINITFERYMAELKNNIKEKTKHYEALLPDIPGEEGQSRELDTIYTNLIMYSGRAGYDFTRGRHEIVEGYLKSQEQYKSINKLEEIFAPKPGNPPERPPRSIMIIGRPGIGKSLLCQKILRDWACGEIFNEETETGRRFEFVCLFKFRHFRSDETMNLQGLLGRGQFLIGFPQEAYDWMLNHPDQVLFIFDGLDEFGGKEKIAEEEPRFVNNHTEIMSFSAMYAKLTLGNLLRGATVVTTSRPTALSCVSFTKYRSLEILGFSYEEIETFVTSFCQVLSDEHSKQIWNHISSNGNLLSLCYVPVSCHILCFTFQERLKPGKGNDVKCLPTTLTEIYKNALIIIIFKHNPNYRHSVKEQDKLLSSLEFFPEVEESLNSLGKVAYAGIKHDRLIFESSEVKGHEESGLLHRLPNVKVGPIQRKEQYCFLHLTLQEFLAAKYIVARIKEGNPEFKSWISGHVLLAGKWEVVMQFVAGLLPDEDNSNLTIFIDSLPHPTIVREEKELVLRLFKYIFEIPKNSNSGWAQLIRNKLRGVVNVDLSGMSLTDADVTSIAFVLREAKNITSLDLSGNYITCIGCKEISHKLLKMLGSSDAHNSSKCKLTALDISGNKIGVEGVKHLSDALATDECKLTTLDISNNKIGVEGVKYLSDALATDECKLATLDIRGNEIGDDGVKYLSDALATDECKLTTLDINNNKIGDDGVKHLSDALATDECKLATLDISNNKVGDDGVKHLSDALATDECKLATLDISGNEIGDDGVKHLSDAFATDECKLATLDISGNEIGVEGVKYLSDALATDECKLTTLDISRNKIGDTGVMHLSDALATNKCKLTNLNIADINVSDDGLSRLLDALRKKECRLTVLGIDAKQKPATLLKYFSNECKLTMLSIEGEEVPYDLLKHLPGAFPTLKISAFRISDDGLKPLCDALSSDNCKLTTLDISGNDVGVEGIKYLSDVLAKDECKLTTLDISMNEIGDEGIKYLSDVLAKDECKLTTLGIGGNEIGVEGVKYLSDVLTKEECKLTTLDISVNEIGDEGVKYLSDALATDECKLTILGISVNEIGVEGVKYLSDVLAKEECKLTTLDISVNEIGDEGVKYLSDALATDECKLTMLGISGNEIGVEGVKYLSDALATDECKLTMLGISGDEIGDEGITYLSDVLAKDECKLTLLGIEMQNAAILLKYFSNECKLTMLNIQGLQGAYDLLNHLSGAFRTLKIIATHIYDDGLKALCDALSSDKCKVTTLKISAEFIYDDGLKPLSDTLSSDNCKLTTLKISASRIFNDGLKPLCDALSSDNCKLTTLNISADHISDYRLKPLCDALSSDNCKLTTLNIYFPGIGEHHVNQLLHALGTKECKITTIKDIEENEIQGWIQTSSTSSMELFQNKNQLKTKEIARPMILECCSRKNYSSCLTSESSKS